MANKKFTFDDTIEYDKDELKPNYDLHASSPKVDDMTNKKEFVFDDTQDGEKPMKKKKKGKFKIKKWQIALIAILSLAIVFLIYVFVAPGGNDGPVYGERCAKLVKIDDTKFKDVESAVKANEKVNDIQIESDCRIIKVTLQFVDNVSSDDATAIATEALHQLDDALGQNKDEGAMWSQLLNKANGRLQYDVEFVLKSNGDTNFPIFGTKHAGVDNISFTGSNVKDQGTTDKVYQRQAEVDAANQAAENN